MLSKIIRRKKKQNPNTERITAYQLIKGFTRCPVSQDGDCFYTATSFFCGLNTDEMRQLVMSYFLFKKAEYSILFESQDDLINAIKENNKPGVWNSDLCDIAPYAAAQALKRSITIYNYDDKKITKICIPVDGDALYPPLHLFRSKNHYEILLDNTKKPNKNIYPLPDVSEFYGVIDLTSVEDADERPEIEYEGEECIIRI